MSGELTEAQRQVIVRIAGWLAGTAENLRMFDGEDVTMEAGEVAETAEMMQSLANELREKFEVYDV